MTKAEVNRILLKVAQQNNVSLETVRKEIRFAIDEAQNNTDPNVQNRWASIPHKGDKVTVEELLAYLSAIGNFRI